MPPIYNVPASEIPIRTLYMRLFREYIDGEEFYPSALAGVHIDLLIQRGHAEACGDGYRITLDGIRAWAEMNRFILTGTSNRAKISQESTVLKSLIPFLINDEEDEMSKLMTALRDLLTLCEKSGDWTDTFGFDKTVLMTAVRQGYVERQAKGIFRITDTGRAWLHGEEPPTRIVNLETLTPEAAPEPNGTGTAFSEPMGTVHHAPETKSPSVEWEFEPADFIDNLRAGTVVGLSLQQCQFVIYLMSAPDNQRFSEFLAAQNKAAPSEPIPCSDCGDCDCLPKRVLAAVMDRVPEVRDLFEAMRAQDILLDKLGERK